MHGSPSLVPSFSLVRGLVLGVGLLGLGGCQLFTSPQLVEEHRLLAANQEQMQEKILELSQQLSDLQQQQTSQNASLIQHLRKIKNENLRLHSVHSLQLEQLNSFLDPNFQRQLQAQVVFEDGKLLLGHHEWVAFPRQNIVLPARIDSGAQTSSLHAVDIQEFERDGEKWIRFTSYLQIAQMPETFVENSAENSQPKAVASLFLENSLPENLHPETSRSKTLIEAPLVRRAKINQASGSESRPVIKLPMQLGAVTQEVEFTLTDRSQLAYPVLLGRSFFMDIAVIDVSQEFIQGKPSLKDG